MIYRRQFLLTAAGAAAMPFAPAFAKSYEVPEEHIPREVRIAPGVEPGEIHVNPDEFALYWTLPDNKAIRYSIGIAKGSLYDHGEFQIARKAKWPSWKPTAAMVKRDPGHYAKYRNGMPGGKGNPLGARALYLYTAKGYDSLLRIHGTTQPWTIGSAVSNGCVRLVNAHVEDLYERVPKGTRVVLNPKGSASVNLIG